LDVLDVPGLAVMIDRGYDGLYDQPAVVKEVNLALEPLLERAYVEKPPYGLHVLS
jgi:hypothetical protein